MSELQTIENIRHLISEGRTNTAAEHLIVLTYTRHKEFYESALMLKNRLETLEKETIEGVLSHSEQSLAQAKIVKSLLALVSNVEEAQRPVLNPIVNIRNNLWQKRKTWVSILAALSITGLAFLGVSKINFKEVFKANEFDLMLVVDITNNHTLALNSNAFKVNLGNKSLTNPLIQNDTIIFQHIPQKQWDDSLKVEWLNTEYDIALQKEERKLDKSVLTRAYKIVEKTTFFEGYIRFPDGQPAPFAVVEIGFRKNVFKATADSSGQYKIQLPRSAVKEVVSLTLKYKGKARINKTITVNEINMASWTLPLSSKN
jgi:Effector-associated domain 11